MDSQSKIIEKIRNFAKKDGWNRFRLASEAGLATRTLRDLHRKSFNPTLCTITKTINFIEQHERKSQ